MTLQHKFLYFVNWSKFILSNKNIFHQREVKSFSSVVRCSLAVSKAGPQGHWGCTSWEPWNKPSPFFWFLLQSGIFMHHQAITSKKLKITSLFTLYAFFERKSFFFKGCILRGISRQDFFLTKVVNYSKCFSLSSSICGLWRIHPCCLKKIPVQ